MKYLQVSCLFGLFLVNTAVLAAGKSPKVEFFVTVDKSPGGGHCVQCEYRVNEQAKFAPKLDIKMFKTTTKIEGDISKLGDLQKAGKVEGESNGAKLPPPPGNEPPAPPPPTSKVSLENIDLEAISFAQLVDNCKDALILRIRAEDTDKPTKIKLIINFADTHEDTYHTIGPAKKIVTVGSKTKCWSGKLKIKHAKK